MLDLQLDVSDELIEILMIKKKLFTPLCIFFREFLLDTMSASMALN